VTNPDTTDPDATDPDTTDPVATEGLASPSAVLAALRRYRIMAYIVGTGLIVLVFVGVPLQYAAGLPQVAEIVGPIHGVMYIVYLVAAVDLGRRGQLATRQLAVVALSGFLPFLAFFVERRITAKVLANLAGPDAPEQAEPEAG
jgi:integral membrane protein